MFKLQPTLSTTNNDGASSVSASSSLQSGTVDQYSRTPGEDSHTRVMSSSVRPLSVRVSHFPFRTVEVKLTQRSLGSFCLTLPSFFCFFWGPAISFPFTLRKHFYCAASWISGQRPREHDSDWVSISRPIRILSLPSQPSFPCPATAPSNIWGWASQLLTWKPGERHDLGSRSESLAGGDLW